jgi:hypothetical protein
LFFHLRLPLDSNRGTRNQKKLPAVPSVHPGGGKTETRNKTDKKEAFFRCLSRFQGAGKPLKHLEPALGRIEKREGKKKRKEKKRRQKKIGWTGGGGSSWVGVIG